MAETVIFSISTEVEMRGRQLKALKPNKDGVYTGIPLTVIGMNSRNNICYDRESVIRCLTDPNSRFVMNLKSGDLEGEWGHPLLSSQPEECVARLLYLDRKNVSHHFTRIYSKEDKEKGIIIVYGDVKPSGPMGKYLTENFADPTRNVSFSLRAATAITGKSNGVTTKKMLAMFTFDAVDGPGYAEACKRFRDPALESLICAGKESTEVTVTKEAFLNATRSLEVAGVESKIIDQRVLDAFGCDEVIIKEKRLRRGRNGALFDADTHAQLSLFDMAYGF